MKYLRYLTVSMISTGVRTCRYFVGTNVRSRYNVDIDEVGQ